MKSKELKTAEHPDEHSIERLIGQRIRERRLECGLSLEAVDDLTGGGKGQTRAFEEGIRFIGPSDLYTLSTALDVDVAAFFAGAKKHPVSAGSLSHTPDVVDGAMRLVQAYYTIEDKALRRSVVELLKDLADDEAI